MSTLHKYSDRLTVQDHQPPPDAPKAPRSDTKSTYRNLNTIAISVSPRSKSESVEGTLDKINQRGVTGPPSRGPTIKPNDCPTREHKLAYPVTRYIRPVGPVVVDQIDLVPGTGMRSTDILCLHCGKTLRPYGISHLKGDGSCPYDCNHCKTRDHQGQLCPRLWLSHSFQRRHGLHMSVQPNLQVRPTPEDLALIARDYPQYSNFVASVRSAGEKKGTEPKKRRVPEELGKAEEPLQKRKQKEYIDLEARVKSIEAQLQRQSEQLILLQARESKELDNTLAEHAEKIPEAILSSPQFLENNITDGEPSVDALLEKALQEEAALYARSKGGERANKKMLKKGRERDNQR